MISPSLATYMACIDRDDWQGVGEILLAGANTLARIGATFLICPDNTVHRALPYIAERLPLPWLHIADVVLQEAKRRGLRKLGIMGTRWLVQSDVYPERIQAHGLSYMLPNESAREEMNRVIMDELVAGIFKDESVAELRATVAQFKRGGCDAVVLGCTELPLALDDTNCALPTLDSTRLLARAALKPDPREFFRVQNSVHGADAILREVECDDAEKAVIRLK